LLALPGRIPYFFHHLLDDALRCAKPVPYKEAQGRRWDVRFLVTVSNKVSNQSATDELRDAEFMFVQQLP